MGPVVDVQKRLDVLRHNIRDIDEQNLRMHQGENTTADIERQARQWIEAHRAEANSWLDEARSAAAGH